MQHSDLVPAAVPDLKLLGKRARHESATCLHSHVQAAALMLTLHWRKLALSASQSASRAASLGELSVTLTARLLAAPAAQVVQPAEP